MTARLSLIDYGFYAMGSPCSVQFFVQTKAQERAAKQAIQQRLQQLEQRYSRYRADSLLSRINASAGLGQPTAIDAETAALLGYAQQCYQESEGLFDVTSGILRRLWHLQQTHLPAASEIEALLPLIGWELVQWNAEQVYLPRVGMQLDFGGIVKEYATDSVAQLLWQQGIRSGIVELGGDIKIIGPQPNGDGWSIAIRNPLQSDQPALNVRLRHGALASSGDYERFQMIDGVRYSHLLNPKTGRPVLGLRAASVFTEHCVVAGSVATIAMLKGDQGVQWLADSELAYFCCTSDGQLLQNLASD